MAGGESGRSSSQAGLDSPRTWRQLSHWLRASDDALVIDVGGRIHGVAERLARDLGRDAVGLAGRPLTDLVPGGDGLLERLGGGAAAEACAVELETPVGSLPARLTGSPIYGDNGDVVGTLVLVERVGEAEAVRSRYSVFVTLLQRVAMAANEADSPTDALEVAVREVCAHTGWPLGHVYMQDPDRPGEVMPSEIWHCASERFAPFVEVTRQTRYGANSGLPGRVLAERTAVWMRREDGGPRAEVAASVGIHCGAGFPVMVGPEVAAILEFFSEHEMADDELLQVMTHVGEQLGRVLARKRAEEALVQSTRDYRGLFENAHDAIVILDADQLTVLAANPAAARQYGKKAEELIDQPIDQLARDPESTRAKLADVVHLERRLFFEDVHRRPDGTEMELEVNASIVEYRGMPAILTIGRDVTQRRMAERALRVSQERYALAARAANDGMWDWDLKTGKVYYSPRWWSILGLEPAQANTTKVWFDLVHPEDAVRLQWELVHHIEGATDHFESEHRLRHADGEYRWVLSRGLAVRDETGRAYRVAGSLSDITERKRAEHQLVHDALHDGLTGLPSRVLFMDRLTRSIKRSKRHTDTQFAVLFLDLDEFKIVNESLGHQAGDHLLIEIGRRIQKSLRSTDTVARLGGDEFAILIEDIHGVDDVTRVAEHIHLQLQQPFEVGGRDVFASGSIGIALSSTGYERAEDLLRDADTAMYRAKSMGRSRHAIFDKQMHANALALLDLETALRKAVESEELVLHYQPVVSLKTGKLAGFEALVRWPRDDGQIVSPLEFIPLAEGTGLIIPLGSWVIREACQLASTWREKFDEQPMQVSVNISAKQVWRGDFVEVVQRFLDESGLDPCWLKLELTESLLMENADAAGSVLSKLRELGVGLCIDDFGTGYSSLSYLQRFPIDTLKIDRSFVSGMARGDSDMMIVRTIISLAHSLGLDLVAEGIETPEQMARLRALGCEYGQGYLFSKPLSVADAEALIKTFPRW